MGHVGIGGAVTGACHTSTPRRRHRHRSGDIDLDAQHATGGMEKVVWGPRRVRGPQTTGGGRPGLGKGPHPDEVLPQMVPAAAETSSSPLLAPVLLPRLRFLIHSR